MILQIDGKEVFIDDRIIAFAHRMQDELTENSIKKGSIFDWKIKDDFPKWLYEFEYHKSKLIASLMAKDCDQTDEYIADLGNYLVCLMFQQPVNIQESVTLCKNPKTKLI